MLLLRRLGQIVSICGITAWFAYCALVMSWAGHRPTRPDVEHPFPYMNHGLIYVSADDLHRSHILLVVAIALIVLTVTIYVIGRARYPDFEPKAGGSASRTTAPVWKTVIFFLGFLLLTWLPTLLRR